MKRLSAAFVLSLAPTLVQAACTGDLPAQNPLKVYADSVSDRIIGGIGLNQCGVEVTDLCANGRCLMFLDGLSGYADVSALQSGSFDPALTAFEYGIVEIGGELSFMGQKQAFRVAEDQPLRIELRADHIVLSLPAPLPSGIRMVSTGSSGWEGLLPDWVGVPVPVTLYLDRLSAQRATLELSADHQLLKMNMLLTLTRLGDLPDRSLAPPSHTSAPDRGWSDCETTHVLAARIGSVGEQSQIEAFYAAVATARITDWDARSADQCAALLAALSAAGITDDPAPDQQDIAMTPHDDCGPLAEVLRPVLRGPASPEKQSVLRAMIAIGITSIGAASQNQCALLANTLED